MSTPAVADNDRQPLIHILAEPPPVVESLLPSLLAELSGRFAVELWATTRTLPLLHKLGLRARRLTALAGGLLLCDGRAVHPPAGTILHCWGFRAARLARRLITTGRYPTVLTATEPPAAGQQRRWFEQLCRCENVHVAAAAEYIRRSLPPVLPAERSHLLPLPPAPTAARGKSPTRPQLRRRLGLQPDQPAVWIDTPDAPDAAWAATIYYEMNRQLRIIIPPALLSEQTPLHRCRRIAQPQQLLYASSEREAAAAADVFLTAARPALPGAGLLEAMAAGTAILAADCPAHRQLLTDGHNALLCNPRNHADTARKLRRLLEDRALRGRLAAAAAQRLAQMPTPAELRRAHLTLYQQLKTQKLFF